MQVYNNYVCLADFSIVRCSFDKTVYLCCPTTNAYTDAKYETLSVTWDGIWISARVMKSMILKHCYINARVRRGKQ